MLTVPGMGSETKSLSSLGYQMLFFIETALSANSADTGRVTGFTVNHGVVHCVAESDSLQFCDLCKTLTVGFSFGIFNLEQRGHLAGRRFRQSKGGGGSGQCWSH